MKSLIVFAKEPERGKIKTRLSNFLSEAQCVRLYKAFLKDIIDMAKGLRCEQKILAYDSRNNPQYLKKIAPSFVFYKQKGINLGQKMHNAFEFAKRNKSAKTVIIGSDSPNLPARFIGEAFRKLDKNDVVIGPSFDGGYYLIALEKPCRRLFEGIKWSSNKVLEHTLKNAKRLKKKVALLDSWYDIDEPDMLGRLKRDLEKKKNKNIAKWTRNFLKI